MQVIFPLDHRSREITLCLEEPVGTAIQRHFFVDGCARYPMAAVGVAFVLNRFHDVAVRMSMITLALRRGSLLRLIVSFVAVVTIVAAAFLMAPFSMASAQAAGASVAAPVDTSTRVEILSNYKSDDTRVVADAYGASSDSGEWLVGYPLNSAENQKFTIYPLSNGSFEIRNFAGLCYYEGTPSNPGYWDTFHRIRPITTADCDSSNDAGVWYFKPRSNGSTVMIANVHDKQCMDLAVKPSSYYWFNMWPCHDRAANQEFRLINPDNQSAWDFTALAAIYGMTECQTSSASCKMARTGVTTSSAGEPVCVMDIGPSASETANYQYQYQSQTGTSTMTGSSVATGISSKVSFGLKAGSPTGGGEFSIGFEQAFTETWTSSYSLTRNANETLTRTYNSGAIPAGKWAWALLTPTVQKYTGSFVFNPGSWDEWSYAADTELTVEVPSATPRVTMSYSATECDGHPSAVGSTLFTGLNAAPQPRAGTTNSEDDPGPRNGGAQPGTGPTSSGQPTPSEGSDTGSMTCVSLNSDELLVASDCTAGSTTLQARADNTVRVGDECLTPDNTVTIFGNVTARLTPCAGIDYQVWTVRPDGIVENKGLGQCLTDPGPGFADHRMYLGDCAHATRLNWPTPTAGTPS